MAKRKVRTKGVHEYRASKEGRTELFKELKKHVENGFSLDCFATLSSVEIEQWLNEFPNEWIESELSESIRKAKAMWESIGYRQAQGTCIGNSRSWYYNMSNRYGWRDKIDQNIESKQSLTVNVVDYSKLKPSDTN